LTMNATSPLGQVKTPTGRQLRLGHNGTTQWWSPLAQTGAESDWVDVATSGSHTVALKNDGSLWAWGLNDYGQLGDGTRTNRSRPVN